MSTQQRGLGRGLDALFDKAGDSTAILQKPTSLPLDRIVAGAQQPRKSFAEEALQELAASIQSQGIIQPLLVRSVHNSPGNYEIIAGERRWRAARIAGLTQVPVFVREMNDTEVLLAALVENLQREDLNPIEEALALKTIREQCQVTQEEMASRLGKSRSAIANALRLLSLSAQAQDDLQTGALHAGHARALLSIPDLSAQERLRSAIVERQLTVREAEQAASHWKANTSFAWDAIAHSPRPIKTQSGNKAPFQNEILGEMEAAIFADLGIKAKITGSPARGKITLAYASADALRHILHSLGVAESDTMFHGKH